MRNLLLGNLITPNDFKTVFYIIENKYGVVFENETITVEATDEEEAVKRAVAIREAREKRKVCATCVLSDIHFIDNHWQVKCRAEKKYSNPCPFYRECYVGNDDFEHFLAKSIVRHRGYRHGIYRTDWKTVNGERIFTLSFYAGREIISINVDRKEVVYGEEGYWGYDYSYQDHYTVREVLNAFGLVDKYRLVRLRELYFLDPKTYKKNIKERRRWHETVVKREDFEKIWKATRGRYQKVLEKIRALPDAIPILQELGFKVTYKMTPSELIYDTYIDDVRVLHTYEQVSDNIKVVNDEVIVEMTYPKDKKPETKKSFLIKVQESKKSSSGAVVLKVLIAEDCGNTLRLVGVRLFGKDEAGQLWSLRLPLGYWLASIDTSERWVMGISKEDEVVLEQ
jgi:hypothetical protein